MNLKCKQIIKLATLIFFITALLSCKTEIKDETLPIKFELLQNYPNPFNPSTVIEYSLPQEVKGEKSKVKKLGETIVTLKVYDVLGREVATLVNEEQVPGYYSVKFDGSNLPSGMYIYKLTCGKYVFQRKLLLLK